MAAQSAMAMINPQLMLRMINPVENGVNEFNLTKRQQVRLEAVAGVEVAALNRVLLPRCQTKGRSVQGAYHLAN
jgi:hypothetical protein